MEDLAFAPDKLLHFILSFLLACVEPVLALIVGIAKELWDMAFGGVAEWGDLAADALGILFALLRR